MGDILKIRISGENLVEIGKLDRFLGAWPTQSAIPAERLDRIEEAARLQSVGAACRLAGIRVSDAEVADVLRGQALNLRDARDIRGYWTAMTHPFPGPGQLLTGADVRVLHSVAMGADPLPAGGSPWRDVSLHREAFDATGKAVGRVFGTAPPRLVEEKTEQLLTWLELELRSGEQHPVLVIGSFLLGFLAVSPFERGSGRAAWLLGHHLLLRAGYDAMSYASLSSIIEEMREPYYDAFDKAQTWLWGGEADLAPWTAFFLDVLGRHRQRVESKLALEREVRDYPPLQQAILEAVREHGTVNAALLLRATGANRNTLKDNLRRLVHSGLIEKTGLRRGTRYRMSCANSPARLAPEN